MKRNNPMYTIDELANQAFSSFLIPATTVLNGLYTDPAYSFWRMLFPTVHTQLRPVQEYSSCAARSYCPQHLSTRNATAENHAPSHPMPEVSAAS